MNMSTLNLNEFFSEMFLSEQWTIVEQFLARDERHGIALAIDGPFGNVMTIGELHWSLSTGTPISAAVSKNIPVFLCKISAGITAFRWKIAAVNLDSQEKFYENGASVVLRRLAVVSAELPAILEK